MAKSPRMTNSKATIAVLKRAPAPVTKPVKIGPTPAPTKAASKPTGTTAATLARAARVQGLEAGESRLARSAPPKNKPATPTMSPAAKAATQAALDRAARMQSLEASESLLLKRGRPDIIRTTVSERMTPPKKSK